MEKPIRLAFGIILILLGLAFPIYTARVYVSFGGSFWLGILVVYISLVLMGVIFFFSAALIGPAYPGILDDVNDFGNRVGRLIVTRMRFAGETSIWKTGEGKVAGVVAGLWHGLISPIALGLSLFNNQIQLYECNNKGFGYNIGYAYGVFVIIRALFMSN